jgi:SAM-dependent MidA family methyltransferase
VTPLEEIIHDRIRRQGPMPFAAYMSLALYHPHHGYYTSGPERSGWRGHYLTSPELDPAFGQLWARGFEQIWDGCGRPSRFEIVEIGPGEGAFAAAVLASSREEFGDSVTYRLVERSQALEERQRAAVADPRAVWSPSVTELPAVDNGVVFANEVIDNLPVHIVEGRAEGVLEVCVDSAEGRLEETLRSPSNPELASFLERTGVRLPGGHRFEVPLAAESLVRRIAAAVTRGTLVLVDYGSDATKLASRPGGSMLCYSESGVDDEPLDRPGDKDITTHANWTSIRAAMESSGLEVIGPTPQHQVMASLGARELDDTLKRRHADALEERRGAEAVSLLSRRQALGALRDPTGLGGLGVIAGLKRMPAPPFLTAGEPK